jgi:hypothetical protein
MRQQSEGPKRCPSLEQDLHSTAVSSDLTGSGQSFAGCSERTAIHRRNSVPTWKGVAVPGVSWVEQDSRIPPGCRESSLIETSTDTLRSPRRTWDQCPSNRACLTEPWGARRAAPDHPPVPTEGIPPSVPTPRRERLRKGQHPCPSSIRPASGHGSYAHGLRRTNGMINDQDHRAESVRARICGACGGCADAEPDGIRRDARPSRAADEQHHHAHARTRSFSGRSG